MKSTTRRLLCFLLALALLGALPPGFLPDAGAANSDKLIAFTFDDGPSTNTPTLLDGLEQRGAVATFFMCGANGTHGVVQHHDYLARMYALGCELANHSYSHSNFFKLNAQQMSGELSGVEEYLYAAMGGKYLDLVRIPGGRDSDAIRENVAHPIIRWSVDPYDWRDRNADTVYERIMEQAFDGAVVLLHDLYPTSIEGGLRAMDTLKQQGYTMVTVSELFRRRGIYMENGAVYSQAPNKGVTKPAYTAPTIEISANASGLSTVIMWSGEPGVETIHYTTDGSVPTLASPKYTGAFTITGETNFKAAGFDRFGTRTPITEKSGGLTVAQPRIGGVDRDKLTLATTARGAKIYYTTDGADPRTAGKEYTAPFAAGTITRAVAVSGKTYSQTTDITKTSGNAFFYDVPWQAWYCKAVGDVVDRKLMTGTSPYYFNPEGQTTRGALVSILYRMEGSPSVRGTPPFTDVPADYWCADAVTWAAANGLINGTTPTTFNPGGTLTRQMAAAILYRYGQKFGRKGNAAAPISGYTDTIRVAAYAETPLGWAVANGMFREAAGSRLRPEDAALRGQVAYMVSALCAIKR